jgi:glycosyltransferase involved in cell wall biosynthesis
VEARGRVAPVQRVVFYEESTGWGGTEKYLFDLATRIAEAGTATELIVRILHPAEESDFVRRFDATGVVLTCIRGDVSSAPTEIKRLASAFRAQGHDCIVHFNQQTPASMATAILAARLAGCSTRVATSHVPSLGYPPHNLVGKSLYRTACRSLAATIFESRENLEIAVRHGIVRRRDARVVLHGVDTTLFRPAEGRTRRRHLAVSPEAFVIGTVGRLEPQKAHSALIRAFAKICDLRPELDPHLVVVGEGSERAALEGLVERFRLEARIHLLGHVEPVSTLYSAFDVFALSSHWEGLPLSLLEAMASGVPVVATDVGGVCDAVDDGENGILIPPGAEKDLVTALLSLADVRRRRALANRAREDALRRFDVHRMVDETLAVYEEAIRMRGSRDRR